MVVSPSRGLGSGFRVSIKVLEAKAIGENPSLILLREYNVEENDEGRREKGEEVKRSETYPSSQCDQCWAWGRRKEERGIERRVREERIEKWAILCSLTYWAPKSMWPDTYSSITSERVKKDVPIDFKNFNSESRLLIATSAFGLGGWGWIVSCFSSSKSQKGST